jgi:predicted transcriptional regulator
MPTETDLSDLQLSLMRVLWDRGECSAADVQRGLGRTRPLAITTVGTLLTRLEKRGLVKHRTEGRAFLFRAAVSEGDVRKRMLSGLVRNLFRGEPTEVVEQLLSHRDVSPGDIERIEAMIKEAKRGEVAKAKEGRKRAR